MEIKLKKEEEAFTPITIELTLQSKAEVTALYSLFNYSDICNFLRIHNIEPDNMRNLIFKYTDGKSCDDALAELKGLVYNG